MDMQKLYVGIMKLNQYLQSELLREAELELKKPEEAQMICNMKLIQAVAAADTLLEYLTSQIDDMVCCPLCKHEVTCAESGEQGCGAECLELSKKPHFEPKDE